MSSVTVSADFVSDPDKSLTSFHSRACIPFRENERLYCTAATYNSSCHPRIPGRDWGPRPYGDVLLLKQDAATVDAVVIGSKIANRSRHFKARSNCLTIHKSPPSWEMITVTVVHSKSAPQLRSRSLSVVIERLRPMPCYHPRLSSESYWPQLTRPYGRSAHRYNGV